MITNPSIDIETQKVLGVVSRAQSVFGGQTEPADAPRFAAARDLEDNLGRGHFGATSAVSERTPITTAGGPADDGGDGDMDNVLSNDFVDRLMTSGAWTWADGGLGERR